LAPECTSESEEFAIFPRGSAPLGSAWGLSGSNRSAHTVVTLTDIDLPLE
jgi:hypothetical protein